MFHVAEFFLMHFCIFWASNPMFFLPLVEKIPNFHQVETLIPKISPLHAAWTTSESPCTPKLIVTACKSSTVLQVSACDNTVKHHAISTCLVPITPQKTSLRIESANIQQEFSYTMMQIWQYFELSKIRDANTQKEKHVANICQCSIFRASKVQ